MGSWEFQRIGVSKTGCDERLKAQLLECLGVDLKAKIYHMMESCFDPSFSCDDILIGDIHGYTDRNMFFSLFNKLFGRTNVYYEYDVGTSVSEYYSREEAVYNADEMTVSERKAVRDHQGDQEAMIGSNFGEIQAACVKYAAEEGVEIDWYPLVKSIKASFYMFWYPNEQYSKLIKALGGKENLLKQNNAEGGDIVTLLYCRYKEQCDTITKELGLDTIEWAGFLDECEEYEPDEFLEIVANVPNGEKVLPFYQSAIEEVIGDCELSSYDNSYSSAIKLVDIDKKQILPIIEKSTELGYTELTALILEKFKDVLADDLDSLTLED